MTTYPIPPVEVPLLQRWYFTFDPEDCGEKRGWQEVGYDTSTWTGVTVPHTWNTMADHTEYEGIAWYRLTFLCPSQASEACARLKFDAVFYLARIWLNGVCLGDHEGGYTPFEFDVSSYILPGMENILAVRVDNQRATDRLPAHLFEGRSYGWNNYGGIVRDVKLVLTSRIYIASQRVVAIPRISDIDQADLASIAVEITIQNCTSEAFTGQLVLHILEDASGEIVASGSRPIDIMPCMALSLPLEESIQNPLLWHFDHPHLYRCATYLEDATGKEYHNITTTFGLRTVELKDGGFLLNGEPVRLVGLSRHANATGYGLAEPTSIMTADFEDLKALNMVFGRPVHYPQHEFIYDYCDHKGILLSPELPAWQLTAGQMADEHMRQLSRQQLAEMVTAAANHPCIWAWSVGNELESDTVAGRAYVRDMVAFVKSLDPTRPVGFASYHLLVGRPWGDATKYADFVMMNQYFGTWHGPKDGLELALDTIHLTWPDKTLIISEFGFAPHWEDIEGPAVIDSSQYYYLPKNVPADSPEADVQRQCVIHDQMAVFRKKSFVAGAIFWDYRGKMGVVDECNNRRDSWQLLRQEYTPVLIESMEVSSFIGRTCHILIKLRTRGPVESDMPAYTIRGYHLQWEFISPDGKEKFSQGIIDLPILTPGSNWAANFESVCPPKTCSFRVKVLRPGGFSVVEKVSILSQ